MCVSITNTFAHRKKSFNILKKKRTNSPTPVFFGVDVMVFSPLQICREVRMYFMYICGFFSQVLNDRHDSYFIISEIKLSITSLFSVQIISYLEASDIIYSDVIDSFISEILKYKFWFLASWRKRSWTMRFTPLKQKPYSVEKSWFFPRLIRHWGNDSIKESNNIHVISVRIDYIMNVECNTSKSFFLS